MGDELRCVLVSKAKAMLDGMGPLTARQRDEGPTVGYVAEYNRIRELAVRVDPAKEELLPPALEWIAGTKPGYAELTSYCSALYEMFRRSSTRLLPLS